MNTLHRNLVIGAGALAVLALLAGDRQRTAAGLDLAGLARAVEREEDHITAVELAEWIRDRKPNLRVLDVRAAADFDAYHIPSAQNVALGTIANVEPHPGETVVLYSDGGTHAAQAWFFLKAQGARNVFFLRGGLNEWLDDVMNPALPANATTLQQRDYERKRELSGYFGGQPDALQGMDPGRAGAGTTERVRSMKRKTC